MELGGEGTPINPRETPQLQEQTGVSAQLELVCSWDAQGRGQFHGATQETPSSSASQGRQESCPGVTVTPASDCRWSGEALHVGAVSIRQSQEGAARAGSCLDLPLLTELL